jgi:L-aminopeptidase/D-esterase-like protein
LLFLVHLILIKGVPVGKYLINDFPIINKTEKGRSGSFIAVIATDAPFNSIKIKNIIKRAALGINLLNNI